MTHHTTAIDVDVGQLEAQRLDLAKQLAALDKLIAAATEYEKIALNGAAPAKSKTASNGATRKKATPPKVECPDCGKRYREGAGMAAHRKQKHGWRKGMPLDRPVPRAVPIGQ